MPRQVYGKKLRAIYDPFAAFGSPQRSSPSNDANEIQIRDVADGFTKLTINETKKCRIKQENKNALREQAANIVPKIAKTDEREATKRPRARRRIVSEDDDDEENTRILSSINHHAVLEEKQELVIIDLNDMKEPIVHDNDEAPLDVNPEDDDFDADEGGPLDEQDDLLHGAPTTIPSSPPPPNDDYTAHCAQLLQLAHHPMTPFSTWSIQLSTHFTITKIAEASFSEVYRLSLLEQLSGFSSSDESVFKIIALKPPPSIAPTHKRKRKTLEGMSGPDDVANEVRLLQRMSVIPGFTNFRDVRVVKGRPPAPFAKAYRDYNTAQKARKKESSHFPDPGKKGSYAEDQLWAVIEMQDAGADLECLVEGDECTSIWSVWDVFWQVVLSLAKGEEGAEFEHRDLHLGNICVRQPPGTNEKDDEIDTKRKLNFTDLETTIIDYTISRALMQDGTTAYQDLARDNGLFEGDSTEEYQYDMYRYMRGVALSNNPYAEPPLPPPGFEGRSWDQYHPLTNLVWLHYVLYKLLEEVERPSECKAPPRRQKAEYLRWKRANDLEHVLFRVQELLDPGLLCGNEDGLKSASDLVGLALRECWLDVEDVVGEGEGEQEEQSALVERLAQIGLDDDTVAIEPVKAKPRTRKKQ